MFNFTRASFVILSFTVEAPTINDKSSNYDHVQYRHIRMDLLAPQFYFIPANAFTQMYRITHQYQLVKGGLADVNEPQIHLLILLNTFAYLKPQVQKETGHLYMLNLQHQICSYRLIMEPDLTITRSYQTFSTSEPMPCPIMIVEVLSLYNKHEQKFETYRQIASLREYVRIDPKRYLIEHAVLQAGNEWKWTQRENRKDTMHLTSIDGHLSLAAIYDKIKINEKSVI